MEVLTPEIIFLSVAGYFVGAIPTGYLLAKYLKGVDIRTVGSGNIGSTNVKRVLGTKLGALTLLLDILKSFGILWGASQCVMEPHGLYIIAYAVLLGNCFSIFLKGQGGKGVATSFGIYLALAPTAAGLGALAYGMGRWASKISAMGSLCAHVAIPIFAFFFYDSLFLTLTVAMSLLIILRHHSNIGDLFQKFCKNCKKV